MKDDLISRQAAIDALSTPHGILYPIRTVEKLPSVQPEERTDKRTETHGVCLDVIDRQAAIDAILAVTGNSSVRELYEHVQEHGLSEMWSGGVNAAIDIIIALPSAQPEIIRCKDCMYYHPSYCEIWSKFGTAQTREQGYCYMAERRIDG